MSKKIDHDIKETCIEALREHGTMPEIGEIRRAKDTDIGWKAHLNCKVIWRLCNICGKGSWTQLLCGQPAHLRCVHCSSKINAAQTHKKNPLWEGGKWLGAIGYVWVSLKPDDFFYPMMTNSRYVPEHWLVMAKSLGRCLQSWESVHHKNGIKNDNRIENLELTTNGAHTLAHNKGYKDGYDKGYYDGKGRIVLELKQRIKELELQIGDGTNDKETKC